MKILSSFNLFGGKVLIVGKGGGNMLDVFGSSVKAIYLSPVKIQLIFRMHLF